MGEYVLGCSARNRQALVLAFDSPSHPVNKNVQVYPMYHKGLPESWDGIEIVIKKKIKLKLDHPLFKACCNHQTHANV